MEKKNKFTLGTERYENIKNLHIKKLSLFLLLLHRKWIKLHNEELHTLNHLPNTLRLIESMRQARHIARIGEVE